MWSTALGGNVKGQRCVGMLAQAAEWLHLCSSESLRAFACATCDWAIVRSLQFWEVVVVVIASTLWILWPPITASNGFGTPLPKWA